MTYNNKNAFATEHKVVDTEQVFYYNKVYYLTLGQSLRLTASNTQ